MTLRTTGAALAGTLALLGAQAAPATAGTPYGGFTARESPVTLTIAKDGRQIQMARTALDMTCTDGSTDFTPDAWQQIALARDGAFRAEFADQQGTSVDGKPMVSSGSVAGRLNARTRRITGTWSYEQRIAQPDGSEVTCTSGAVRFSASAFTGRRPLRRGLWGAFSSDDHPLVFDVAPDGRRVTRARGAFELRCSKGGYRFVTDDWVRLPIDARGRFKASTAGTEEELGDGPGYRVTSSVSGLVSRSGRRLTGTWSVRWEIPEPDGVTDVCTSGPVRFRVLR